VDIGVVVLSRKMKKLHYLKALIKIILFFIQGAIPSDMSELSGIGQ
jgi:hypothetical protein